MVPLSSFHPSKETLRRGDGNFSFPAYPTPVVQSELTAFHTQAASRESSALDPTGRTELTDAAVKSRLTRPLAKRYASKSVAVAAFLGPIAAGYRTQAARAKSGHARRWFEQHADHVESWLEHLASIGPAGR